MPKTTRALEQQVAQADQNVADARHGTMAMMIPRAKEPLDPAALNSVGDLLTKAVPILSSGQVPDLQLAQVTKPQPKVPSDIGAQILTLGAFVEKGAPQIKALQSYKFDPVSSMETNAGLNELQGIIGGIMSDKAVTGALQGAAPPAPAEPATEPPMEGGPDGG